MATVQRRGKPSSVMEALRQLEAKDAKPAKKEKPATIVPSRVRCENVKQNKLTGAQRCCLLSGHRGAHSYISARDEAKP